MDAKARKRGGVHYTPEVLARFLSEQTIRLFESRQSLSKSDSDSPIRVLDPACGDGALLESIYFQLSDDDRRRAVLVGFDQDSLAVSDSKSRLSRLDVEVVIECKDFLTLGLDSMAEIVIANPPYVRTQVLGAKRSQKLARLFGLTGRVDLYQAFAMAISCALVPNGVMGLLTSNRFLTVRSGNRMRALLTDEFWLDSIFDLGDTKLFDAAVLPVVVTGCRKDPSDSEPAESPNSAEMERPSKPTRFVRAYASETSDDSQPQNQEVGDSVVNAICETNLKGVVRCGDGTFAIERGELDFANPNDSSSRWMLANAETRAWLETLNSRQCCTFGDVAEIKVGIKTTADKVFVRTEEDWNTLEPSEKPEAALLRPLITHHDARRWRIDAPIKQVLYPYKETAVREPVELDDFPNARCYLESNRTKLESRSYVIDAGRKWFEIWVPHRPSEWSHRKIVWPDISERPRFFLDESGAIVNGDCYWIQLKRDVDPEWMYLILAVANSTVATRFYDVVFHNKLYAGRRRFMTQYVKSFPLPSIEASVSIAIIEATKALLFSHSCCDEKAVAQFKKDEQVLNCLVESAFGF